MTNKGAKFLEGQVKELRQSLGNILKTNKEFTEISLRVKAELEELQLSHDSMLEPSLFKALWKWFIKWRNYRKS